MITVFDDIARQGQGSFGYIPGWGDRGLWGHGSKMEYTSGGIIVFSTDVNTGLCFISLLNIIGDGVSFSIGNFFKGRYVSQGKVFDEKSASIEVLGQPTEVLIALGTEIAREFSQETVLLKDFNTGKNILVDRV